MSSGNHDDNNNNVNSDSEAKAKTDDVTLDDIINHMTRASLEQPRNTIVAAEQDGPTNDQIDGGMEMLSLIQAMLSQGEALGLVPEKGPKVPLVAPEILRAALLADTMVEHSDHKTDNDDNHENLKKSTLSKLADMSHEDLWKIFNGLVEKAMLGSYMLQPSPFHTVSDEDMLSRFGDSGLTCKAFREHVPIKDYGFGLKAWVRANKMDLTAPADYHYRKINNDIDTSEILANINEKALPPVDFQNLVSKFDDNTTDNSPPTKILQAYIELAEPCQGGKAQPDSTIADDSRREWSVLVCLAAAIGVHEQCSNGTWPQVTANIVMGLLQSNTNEMEAFLLSALGGFLLVDDHDGALVMAKYIIGLMGGFQGILNAFTNGGSQQEVSFGVSKALGIELHRTDSFPDESQFRRAAALANASQEEDSSLAKAIIAAASSGTKQKPDE